MSFASDVGLDLPVIAIDKTYRCVQRSITFGHGVPWLLAAVVGFYYRATARIAAPHCAF